jgi:exopolyphosphatase/guanosine-5'-triphosphate,3'-diphosphate pyrophosphatase
MSPVKASIDLGTNTARLLIAEVEGGRVVPLRIERRITRLGGGFSRETGISAAAWERSLAALAEFARAIDACRVTEVKAVATSAVRDARNGAAFCRAVEEATSICLTVIDGQQEGEFTLRGVASVVGSPASPLMVFDVGGGSTEYTLRHPDAPLFVRSLPLGVVRLTEGKGSLAAMTDKIDRELFGLRQELELAGRLEQLSEAILVGTAGTATTLAAIDLSLERYDSRRINNHVLSRERVRELLQLLAPMPPAERLSVTGLEPGREDLIIAGILITLRSMELLGFPSFTVSDAGLLEGLLLDSCPVQMN